jgi:hypothetical protein
MSVAFAPALKPDLTEAWLGGVHVVVRKNGHPV